ncbi:MAG: phosphoglucosamine mutase [Synergistaceae bacterium]|jgi:phosphoglucosamine mutase|nr:phosphoglucosamine mutase [Synergistaceae bacterium]
MSETGKIRCLFGTDGVRDIANRGLMTPEMALSLGRAFVLFMTERGIPRPTVALGRDTRRSGYMLEAALSAGLTSAGADVLSLGVIPTPGVSYTVRHTGIHGGAVISASHNPAEYNGIKFLDSKGYKLSDDDEAAIEEYLGDPLMDEWRPSGASIGVVRQSPESVLRYRDWLRGLFGEGWLSGKVAVIDCANGAASMIAGELFSGCGLDVRMVGNCPDGLNINEGVGVMHMPHLARAISDSGAHFGIALDGDADRVLLADSKGRVIDGDILLWVLARWLQKKGTLGSGVVSTVMSNMALEERLSEIGIPLTRCPVGDRYVLEGMKKSNSRLGGEQSGHIILYQHVHTGDGLCTALNFLKACEELGEDVDTLVDRFARFPQLLRNFRVEAKSGILESERVQKAIRDCQQRLGDKGRVFVRMSGTEPLVRILVEAREEALLSEITDRILETIRAAGTESAPERRG